MPENKCLFCGYKKKLIKAHIISKSLYSLSTTNEPTKLVSSNSKYIAKRAPIGVYDKNILCSDCDNKIGEWDEYAATFFKNKFQSNHYILDDNGIKVAYQITSFKYDKLKLFYLSLLWRACVSSHVFFRKVNLGPYQEKLHQHLLRNDPGSPDQFAIIISKFNYDSKMIPLLDPQRSRYDGVNVYKIYFYGYMSLVKVDKRSYFDTLEPFVVRPDRNIIVLLRDYRNSKEFSLMRKVVENTGSIRPDQVSRDRLAREKSGTVDYK